MDGNEYIDYLLAMGPLILGHSPPSVIEAVRTQIEKLVISGTPSPIEAEVAERICAMVPCAERVTFTNTGTEATMHAIRFARAYTGKDKLLKFEGQYHGTHDYVAISYSEAPSAAMGTRIAPYKVPLCAGIPQETLSTVLVLPWNDSAVLEKTIKRHAHEIAAVITEPAMANLGFIPPENGYLKTMRELTEANDIVMIFDEIKTGFRLALGGAQEVYGVTPDLACYAKALGGGFPIAAIAGKKEILESAALRAGTYTANPVALAAAKATLTELSSNGGAPYKHLNRVGKMLMDGLDHAIEKNKIDMLIQGYGPIFGWFFTERKKIKDSRDFTEVNRGRGGEFAKQMMKRGIYINRMENFYLSTAHTEEDVERTLSAADESLKSLT